MGTKRDRVKCAVRKTVKWGGAGLTVLLVVVWIGSGWWNVMWRNSGDGSVDVAGGQLFFYEPLFGQYSGKYYRPYFYNYHLAWNWWFRKGMGRSGPFWAIPLWLPALLSLLATAAAWRADLKYIRRARAGLCGSCGYDRAGLAAGAVCPECGSPATSSPSNTPKTESVPPAGEHPRLCANCGYSLAGLPPVGGATSCPECGLANTGAEGRTSLARSLLPYFGGAAPAVLAAVLVRLFDLDFDERADDAAGLLEFAGVFAGAILAGALTLRLLAREPAGDLPRRSLRRRWALALAVAVGSACLNLFVLIVVLYALPGEIR